MKARAIGERIHWVGVLDWDRRLFDSLIPIPEGTTYNAYVVQGSDGVALIDTVEPSFAEVLLARLADLGIDRLDYVVSNHAEQDHSGSLPVVLERFPEAKLLCTKKAASMLTDLLPIPAERIQVVADGEQISLGDRTLEFVHFPWVHWPETMLTWVPEDQVLFSCDLFGSHLATNELITSEPERLHLAAKLYFAQIMMPLRKFIAKKLPTVEALPIRLLAPSHGPCTDRPEEVVGAYREWVGERTRNTAVVAYVSMHDSTRRMVDHLVDALTDHGVKVERFDLEEVDVGRLATALVDATTLVLGTPTVLNSAHPNAMYAAYLANMLGPRLKNVAVVGSYGWAGRAAKQIHEALAGLKLEPMEPVQAKGLPDEQTFVSLDGLAQAIADRHAEQLG